MSFIKSMIKPPYSQEQLLSSVAVSRAIPLMSIPAMAGVLMVLLTTFVNTYFIGRLHSVYALAAMSVVYPLTLFSITIAMVFGAGLAAAIGRRLGAKDKEESSRLASTVFAMCAAAAFVFAALGIAFREPLFTALGASKEVLLYAKEFFIIQLAAAFFSSCSQLLNYICICRKQHGLGAAAFILSALLHTLLTPVFIFAFNMGLAGAAVSTLISQLVSFTILLLPFLKKKMLTELSFAQFRLQKGMIAEVVRSGLPLGLSQALMAVSVALTNIIGRAVLLRDSVSFLAGYGISVKLVVMVQYLLISYMIGFQSIAAYSYGAKDGNRFWTAYRHSQKVMLIADVVVAAVFSALCVPIMRMFSNDAQTIAFGSSMIISMCAGLAISFPLPAIITSLQASGKGAVGALVSSLRQGICYIPLVFILPRLFFERGFYLVQPISDLLSVTISIVLFARFRKEANMSLENAQAL